MGVFAQDPAPPIDMAARKASIVTLEAHINQRETRLAEMRDDIKTLDGRIEKRIDELVKMLSDTRDSPNSKTRVSQIKSAAIAGLKRSIDLYVSKRREVAERIKQEGDQAALGDLKKFDERILKRVGQITELTKSFPGYKDVDKYVSDGSSYWNGYYTENTRISDDWRQSRRDQSQSKVQRDETLAALRDAIERQAQRRADISDGLANSKLTEATRKLYQQEIGEIDAASDRINSDIVEISTPGGSSATQAPGLNEAMDMGHMLDDARKDLRQDMGNLFHLYDEFDKGRSSTNDLKENLIARKKWMEANDIAPAAK